MIVSTLVIRRVTLTCLATNITIIDMSNRRVISPDLFNAPSLGARKQELDIKFQMPQTIAGGKCMKEGDCVLALNWDAVAIQQTFQSCVDFVLNV